MHKSESKLRNPYNTFLAQSLCVFNTTFKTCRKRATHLKALMPADVAKYVNLIHSSVQAVWADIDDSNDDGYPHKLLARLSAQIPDDGVNDNHNSSAIDANELFRRIFPDPPASPPPHTADGATTDSSDSCVAIPDNL